VSLFSGCHTLFSATENAPNSFWKKQQQQQEELHYLWWNATYLKSSIWRRTGKRIWKENLNEIKQQKSSGERVWGGSSSAARCTLRTPQEAKRRPATCCSAGCPWRPRLRIQIPTQGTELQAYLRRSLLLQRPAQRHTCRSPPRHISSCCAAMYSPTLARCLLVFTRIWLSSKMGENQQEAVGVQSPSPDMMYYVKGCNRSYRWYKLLAVLCVSPRATVVTFTGPFTFISWCETAALDLFHVCSPGSHAYSSSEIH